MIITTGIGKKSVYTFWMILLFLFAYVSCRKKPDVKNLDTAVMRIPVTFVHPVTGSVVRYLDLNGTSVYMGKEMIRSTATGYVFAVKKSLGEKVLPGQAVFIVRTKESAALQEYVDSISDPNDIRFSGLIPVTAHQPGVIGSINYFAGGYVHEGDVLATVLQPKTIVFRINVPYEYHRFIQTGDVCQLIFPGNTLKNGYISKVLPTVDPSTQTQQYFVTLNHYELIPENLKVVVKVPVSKTINAVILPKSAVLSNEMQTDFWIMKIIRDTLAVKVPVVPGIVSSDSVEIISPALALTDSVILQGNYGLADSAVVQITNK